MRTQGWNAQPVLWLQLRGHTLCCQNLYLQPRTSAVNARVYTRAEMSAFVSENCLNFFEQLKKKPYWNFMYPASPPPRSPFFLPLLALPKFSSQWGLTVMHMNSSMSHNRATNPHCGSGDSLSYTSNKGELPVSTITVSSSENKVSPTPCRLRSVVWSCVCAVWMHMVVCVCVSLGIQRHVGPVCLCVCWQCVWIFNASLKTVIPACSFGPVKSVQCCYNILFCGWGKVSIHWKQCCHSIQDVHRQSDPHTKAHTCVCKQCPLKLSHPASPWKPVFRSTGA